jgi:hypothetical protein
MKKYKIIIILFASIQLGSCSLQEDPPYLATSNIFENLENARGALNGVYNGFAAWGYFGYSMHEITAGGSGLFTRRTWRKLNDPYNLTLYALKPTANLKDLENVWLQSYTIITRANDIIANVKPVDNPTTDNDKGMNDVLGQAYFARAYAYLNLVRFWGDIPLRTEQVNTDNIHLGKTPAKEVYVQIIEDAELATRYTFPVEEQRTGYPAAEAAYMLLAKAYMTLATADPAVQSNSAAEYWQKAYDAAKQVYGKYSLIDYESLWEDEAGDNSPENIFEIQSNATDGGGLVRLYNPKGSTVGNNTWGRLNVNAEVYDDHAATYPGDPRISSTYISLWNNVVKNRTEKTYPEVANRTNYNTAFPIAYKYWSKDPNLTLNTNNKNFIVYRYADLLLMLAEISNELQNGEQLGYVAEVLSRVSLAPQAGYSGTQDDFREAIMKEYRYELLNEDEDWFRERRRGFQWFKEHVIDVHNANYVDGADILFSDIDESVMLLPFPASEINTNEEID